MEQWRPIDSAPKDGTKILVFTHHGDVELSEWFKTLQDRYEPAGDGLFRKVEDVCYEGWNSNLPLFWMPLPAPPEGFDYGEEIA